MSFVKVAVEAVSFFKRKKGLSLQMKKAFGALLVVIFTGAFLTCMSADRLQAQDFYGEGNVLVAVDMSEYAENEDAVYHEGSMGTLTWGDDAPTGVSSRDTFDSRMYTVPDDISVKSAPEYDIERNYEVGQKLILPVFAGDEGVEGETKLIPASAFPGEIFENGDEALLYNPQYTKKAKGKTYYYAYVGKTGEDEWVPLMDFIEIECVYTGEYSTVWQYTGKVFSNRKDFDPKEYGEAVNLLESEIKIFANICDESYTVQKEIFGDPAFEDRLGDRDGKAAYVVVDTYELETDVAAYFEPHNTESFGFDSLVCKAKTFRSYLNEEYGFSKYYFLSLLVHELNHYILDGLTGQEGNVWSSWLGEAFAQYSLNFFPSEVSALIDGFLVDLTNAMASNLMGTPGMLWDYDGKGNYPLLGYTPYAIGSGFMQYVEREATGKTDGRFWTEYISEYLGKAPVVPAHVDKFLKEKTGEDLRYWMASFMASFALDYDNWFNSFDDYGKNIGRFSDEFMGVYAVKGGGTTYVYTNYDGGRIAVTGADDDWYFFAVTLDIPDPDSAIVISSAEELAQIGKKHSHPFNGRYVLARDIGLGGESSPWEPIGGKKQAFRGSFDGRGHTISGLWAVDEDKEGVGLFGWIEGGALIENLTIEGTAIGKENVGGVVGRIASSTIRNCESRVSVKGKQKTGGICGECLENSLVFECSVSGTINGEYITGGIVGYAEESSASDLLSSGDVDGKECVGGIIGMNVASHVSDCKNSGNVTGSVWVGGITGYIEAYCLTENSHNSGKVKGTDNVGGIVGLIAGADLSVCTNSTPGISKIGDALGDSFSYKKNGDATVLARKAGSGSRTKLVIDTFSWDGITHRITSVGKGAMKGLEKLKKVKLGESVKKIGREAFAGDKKLKRIELTASVTKIGKNAFKGISKKAVFSIKASQEDFERIVELLKKSGVSDTVTFERV